MSIIGRVLDRMGRDDPLTLEEASLSRDEVAVEDMQRDEPLGDMLDVVANERRRNIIRYLRFVKPGETIDVSDLAQTIAGLEESVHPPDVDRKARRRVYVALIQTHLPRMDKSEVIDYRKSRKTVARDLRWSEADEILVKIADTYAASRGGELDDV